MPRKSYQIPIFKAEREAGLAKEIQANASIAYITRLEDTKLSQSVAEEFMRSVSSEIDEDQFDLFYLNTILVTTGMNKNRDVFIKEPTWAARYSPIHKQFNLEHDQSKIIGHMTSAKAVNENFEAIDDDVTIEDLPDKFHILTGAVIYRALSDENAQDVIEKIIQEIHAGEWYVSMECLFRGFDYASISATGEQKIIPRNEDTAWLTKHLRQYGGTGEYNGFSLGRVLQNITFSGKGLVRKPANPDSVILNDNITAFKASFASLGYITTSSDSNTNSTTLENQERVSMANENDSQVKALEQQLDAVRKENTTLAEQLKTYESSAVTAKITALEADVTTKNARVAQLEEELKAANNKTSDLEGKVTAAEEKAAKAEKELSDLRSAELTRSRVEKLTKLNAPEDEAKQIVGLFSDRSDEQFDTLTALFVSKWKPQETVASTEKPVVKETKVDQNALIDAEPEPDATLAASTNKDVENVRQAMAKVFEGFLNSPKISTQNDEL